MLGNEDRRVLVEQALALIEQLYVHLPLKRAMHAVDPLQGLRLLKHRSARLSDSAFHAEMLSIFTRLRDLHTTYLLPEPLRSQIAYLPFRIAEFYEPAGPPGAEGDEPRYVVTAVQPDAEGEGFVRGVRITHWNGIPIHRAVEINADREAGSNLDARHSRGLAAMTLRPLAMSLPPDEDWVSVTYRSRGRSRERRFVWQVFEPGLPNGGTGALAGGDLSIVLGIDAKAELERQARRLLFSPEAVEIARRVRAQTLPAPTGGAPAVVAAAGAAVDFSVVSKLPDVFTFRAVATSHGRFAYVRIQTFNVADDAIFVDELVRILALLPQNGLILDVRGNGGGSIVAAERLLQVLTPRPIEPERFYFINSPLTLQLCETLPYLAEWRESIAQAVETGAAFSHGFSLVPVEKYNDLGQKYQGPVVLVTDARCYSATDIFAAGFQDHRIGRILGTSGTTGAGGANVWSYELLRQMFPGESPFRPLPGNASFRVAVRRCTRVGKGSGTLVEDLGVTADAVHRITRRDVLHGNLDLLDRAAEMLRVMPVQSVVARVEAAAGGCRVAVTTANVDRLDVFLAGRPERSLDIDGRSALFDLPTLPAGATLELRGFRAGEWVATTRLDL